MAFDNNTILVQLSARIMRSLGMDPGMTRLPEMSLPGKEIDAPSHWTRYAHDSVHRDPKGAVKANFAQQTLKKKVFVEQRYSNLKA